jgi:hypothetical protein
MVGVSDVFIGIYVIQMPDHDLRENCQIGKSSDVELSMLTVLAPGEGVCIFEGGTESL